MGPLQTLVIQCQMGRVVVAQVVPGSGVPACLRERHVLPFLTHHSYQHGCAGLLLCVLAEGTAELKAVRSITRPLFGLLSTSTINFSGFSDMTRVRVTQVEGRVRALQGVLEQPLLKVFPRGAQHVNRPDEIDDEARGE